MAEDQEDAPAGKVPTLEQWCRALAAVVLLTSRESELHDFLAPENAERTADFIYRFALGESVARPRFKEPTD